MKSNETRISLLKRVLKADDNFRSLARELAGYEWDFNEEPVLLRKKDVKDLLTRFLAGEVGGDFVHEWAEFLEVREDIDYPPDAEDFLSDIMYELANPDLEGKLTTDRARTLAARL